MGKTIKTREFPCIEFTVEVANQHGEWRIWINQEQVEPSKKENKEIDTLYHDIMEIINGSLKTVEKHQAVARLKKVNAVQYRVKMGEVTIGNIIYSVDFNEDPHG